MAKTNPAAPVRVIEETPAYWRVVFEYPPFNIVDATMFEGLQDLLVRMDTRQSLRVVVFETTPGRACVSSYSRARILTFTSPTLI